MIRARLIAPGLCSVHYVPSLLARWLLGREEYDRLAIGPDWRWDVGGKRCPGDVLHAIYEAVAWDRVLRNMID